MTKVRDGYMCETCWAIPEKIVCPKCDYGYCQDCIIVRDGNIYCPNCWEKGFKKLTLRK